MQVTLRVLRVKDLYNGLIIKILQKPTYLFWNNKYELSQLKTKAVFFSVRDTIFPLPNFNPSGNIYCFQE